MWHLGYNIYGFTGYTYLAPSCVEFVKFSMNDFTIKFYVWHIVLVVVDYVFVYFGCKKTLLCFLID